MERATRYGAAGVAFATGMTIVGVVVVAIVAAVVPASGAGAAANVADSSAVTATAPQLEMLSVSAPGVEVDRDSRDASIDDTGTLVAFTSAAANLALGDVNGVSDVFVDDARSGRRQWVSRASGGVPADGSSTESEISGDGRYVVFASEATNLVAGDTNGVQDVFRHDLVTGETVLVSAAPGGNADGASGSPSVSRDGRFVAFASRATDLVVGDTNGSPDVFLRDMGTGRTTRVSVRGDGGQGPGGIDVTGGTAVSDDGRVVAFSTGLQLDAADRNSALDVYVRDLSAARTEWLTTSPPEAVPSSGDRVSMDGSGRLVAFSTALPLVPGDETFSTDVYVRDRQTGTTTRRSTGTVGPSDRPAYLPDLSRDGRFLAFVSTRPDIVPGVRYSAPRAYRQDLATGTTILVSPPVPGVPVDQGADDSGGLALDSDGSVVAFTLDAPDLVPDDRNGVVDAFVRDVSAAVTARLSTAAAGRPGGGPSTRADVSGDGRVAVFERVLPTSSPTTATVPLSTPFSRAPPPPSNAWDRRRRRPGPDPASRVPRSVVTAMSSPSPRPTRTSSRGTPTTWPTPSSGTSAPASSSGCRSRPPEPRHRSPRRRRTSAPTVASSCSCRVHRISCPATPTGRRTSSRTTGSPESRAWCPGRRPVSRVPTCRPVPPSVPTAES